MTFLLVKVGCAECAGGWDPELVKPLGIYPALQEAQDAVHCHDEWTQTGWGASMISGDGGWAVVDLDRVEGK
jgi:hypothetical protein